MDVDWSHRADYMRQRHGVTVEQANEALADLAAIVADPDPKSRSGNSARVIGYCESAGAVLVVILVHRQDRSGAWWGGNGWPANNTDQRTYTEQNTDQQNTDQQNTDQQNTDQQNTDQQNTDQKNAETETGDE